MSGIGLSFSPPESPSTADEYATYATSSLKKWYRRVDEEAAAVHSTEGRSSSQPLGKRSLPAPFAHTTRLCMDVDQLSSDVQNLGVNSH
jgi:hypothetical protein